MKDQRWNEGDLALIADDYWGDVVYEIVQIEYDRVPNFGGIPNYGDNYSCHPVAAKLRVWYCDTSHLDETIALILMMQCNGRRVDYEMLRAPNPLVLLAQSSL